MAYVVIGLVIVLVGWFLIFEAQMQKQEKEILDLKALVADLKKYLLTR